MPKRKKTSLFHDLRIKLSQDPKHNKELLDFACGLDYGCIAVEDEFLLVKKAQVLPPKDVSAVINGYPGCMQKPIKLLRRLTILVEDPSLLHVLASPAVSQYDIVAIQPNSERTFQQACATLPIDIIAMEMTTQLPFTLRRQQIGQAIERGVMFEISYSPAILDSNARRYTFSNALNLVRLCKGKNVIVSSKAQQSMELRAPYDVANLCHLFGIKGGGKCKDLITTHCQLAVLHAEMRRGSAKGIVTSCSVQDLEDEERWQIADPFDITSGARLKTVDDKNDESSSELKSAVRKRSQSHTPTRKSKKAKTET